MLDRVFALVPSPARVLDTPCGAGRVSMHLAAQGYEMSAGDISDSMLEITRERFKEAELEIPVQKEDVEALSYEDKSFDAAVCFRFFHHLPTPELRQKVIGELCRVAKKHVVISYNNPANIRGVEHWVRKIRPWGRKIRINNTSLSEVEGYFNKCGFRLVEDFPFKRLIHNLHTAVFKAVE